MLYYQEQLDWQRVLDLLEALDPDHSYSFSFPGSSFGHAAGRAILRRGHSSYTCDIIRDPLVVLRTLASKAQENINKAAHILEEAKELGYNEPDPEDVADAELGITHEELGR